MRMTMNIIVLIGKDVPVYMNEYPRRQQSSRNSFPTARKLISPRTEPTQEYKIILSHIRTKVFTAMKIKLNRNSTLKLFANK
jgi:hypothetical protein